MEKLPEEFIRLKNIENPLFKKLYFIGILTKYLERKNIKPIIVGGYAVEFYTLGSYSTGDIDIVVTEDFHEITNTLQNWGFHKIGRIWVNPHLDIEIDIVGETLAGDYSKISQIEVEGLKVYLIGIEDLIIDRLNAWVWWKSEEDKQWAKQLWKLHQEEIDKDYLKKRAKEEKIVEALEELEK